MSPFTPRLRLARSPGTRRSLGGGGGWGRGRGGIYVLFLSNFVSPGQSRSRPSVWDFEAERREAPQALMVIRCPQACRGVELHTARPTRNSDCPANFHIDLKYAATCCPVVVAFLCLVFQNKTLSPFSSQFFLSISGGFSLISSDDDFSGCSFSSSPDKGMQMNSCQRKWKDVLGGFHPDGESLLDTLDLYFPRKFPASATSS